MSYTNRKRRGDINYGNNKKQDKGSLKINQNEIKVIGNINKKESLNDSKIQDKSVEIAKDFIKNRNKLTINQVMEESSSAFHSSSNPSKNLRYILDSKQKKRDQNKIERKNKKILNPNQNLIEQKTEQQKKKDKMNQLSEQIKMEKEKIIQESGRKQKLNRMKAELHHQQIQEQQKVDSKKQLSKKSQIKSKSQGKSQNQKGKKGSKIIKEGYGPSSSSQSQESKKEGKRSKSFDPQYEKESSESDSEQNNQENEIIQSIRNTEAYVFNRNTQFIDMVDERMIFQRPLIFRRNNLKRLFENILTETDPHITVPNNTVDYFCNIFTKFIFDKDCYEFWKVRNDQTDLKNLTEQVKMDIFYENCWNQHYQFDFQNKYK